MLTLTHTSLATVSQLFQYKSQGLALDPFPGYTDDQWGIKAHNRPWIVDAGNFKQGQKVVEVGGAYSTLPKFLADKYGLEAWVADDFGATWDAEVWSRWGDPSELPRINPNVHYSFENFGSFVEVHPTEYFDRVLSVSTLEHIPRPKRLAVLKDMNRCLKPGGRQLHTIDVKVGSWQEMLVRTVFDYFPPFAPLARRRSDIATWISLFRRSGINIAANIPRASALLNRKVLVESPDVVYRFYPPNNSPKQYRPSASLLVIIEDV